MADRPGVRMKYLPPLEGEHLAVYSSMPKLGGFVLSLFQIDDPAKRERYEAEWREWARGRDRRWWPDWLEQWADHKARQPRPRS